MHFTISSDSECPEIVSVLGANVHIECKFKANSPGTTEQIEFSVNRTTDRYGVYKLDIPSLEGVDCSEGPEIQSFCQVKLIGSTSSACNVPGLSSTTNEITLKSKQSNLCIYSMSALSYRPRARNVTLCRNKKTRFLPYSFNSSKFFLPNFPPYNGIYWPPLPQFPPFPRLPPFPSFPFSPLPPLPSLPPLPPLPSLPPLPPLPSLPPFPFPPTTIPKPPSSSSMYPPFPPFPPSPPLPGYNPGDPRTWTPDNPFVSPPRPPGFNLGDPRTWIPNYPPAPPVTPQQQHP